MEQFERSHTYDLIKKAQAGDAEAKNRLAEENMGLVYSIARRFYGRGFEQEDLNQVGAIGLIKAAGRFDPSFGVQFSTYAVPLIMGEIKRFIRDDGPVKVSRDLKRTASEAARAAEELQKKQGREPGVLEIAKVLGLPPEEVVQAREAALPPESFSAARGDGGQTLADFIPSKETEGALLDRLDVKSAVEGLPQRDKAIIVMRYFLGRTQSEVAKKLGISQVQVSRLEKKILASFKILLKCDI